MSRRSTLLAFLTACTLGAVLLLWHIPTARGAQSPALGPTPTLAPDPEAELTLDSISPCGSIEELVRLAKQQLPELFHVASLDAENFGMGKDASLARTRLLTPYQIYWPDEASAKAASDDQALLSNLVPSGLWRIAVDWGDGDGALIMAHCSPEGWRVTGVGGKNELASVRNALRALGVPDALGSRAAGPSFYFVQGYPLSPDVVLACDVKALKAVTLDAEAITRSVEGRSLSTRPAAEAIEEMVAAR
jgi:hypothetical protein